MATLECSGPTTARIEHSYLDEAHGNDFLKWLYEDKIP